MHEFIITSTFDKNWNKANLADEDLRKLQVFMIRNPNHGDMIVGTGGLRKLRWMLSDKGKSGGVRVLYVDFVSHGKIILVNCYSKVEKETLTDKEKSLYKDFINTIRKELTQ